MLHSWEQIYADNKSYRSHHPWDFIVSLMYQKKATIGRKLNILELGSGCGNNLIPLSDLISVGVGIDVSKTAVDYANRWASNLDLTSISFIQHDLTEVQNLSIDNKFDLIFDRACLSLVKKQSLQNILHWATSHMSNDGSLFLNLYSDMNSSLNPSMCDSSILDQVGSVRAPFAQYYSRKDLFEIAIKHQLDIKSLKLVQETDVHSQYQTVHAEWRLLATLSS